MISSVVEQYLDMVEVTGSNPVSCTILHPFVPIFLPFGYLLAFIIIDNLIKG